jgi:hypothetical protein
MPSVTVHLHLAGLVLDRWRAAPRLAPFPPDCEEDVNAFLVGAMGPDMGYLPGGFRPLSELSHSLWTADLTRHLLRSARTSRQRAFSSGWATHVMADILIHPTVGCAVGELIHGSPRHFLDGDQDPLTHIRVEAGVDAVYAQRRPELRKLALRPAFDHRSIRFVHDAYVATYGAAPHPSRILESHVLAPRRMRQGLVLAGLSALAMPPHPERTGRPPGPLIRVRRFVSCRSISLAFLLPAPPRLWLLNAIRDVEENFAELFLEEFDRGLDGLPNLNLDTGRPDVTESSYGGLRRALEYLESQGVRVPALPASTQGAA